MVKKLYLKGTEMTGKINTIITFCDFVSKYNLEVLVKKLSEQQRENLMYKVVDVLNGKRLDKELRAVTLVGTASQAKTKSCAYEKDGTKHSSLFSIMFIKSKNQFNKSFQKGL